MLRRFFSTFAEGDAVLVRPLKLVALPYLVRSLAKGQLSHTKNGVVCHDDLIGQPKRVFLKYKIRDRDGPRSASRVLRDTSAARYVATQPTLDEYTSMVPRAAQPIYSMDANTIVALADISVDAGDADGPRHFLEAGTGNGLLTLSICSALHGANTLARHYKDPSRRGAILHSIDRREDHSRTGAKNVQGYQRGRYALDVEFSVHELPASFLAANPLVLHGVFLDLPNPELYLRDIARHMDLEATLVVFCPSVTQILRCRECLADARLHHSPIDLVLVKTVELPPGNGGGTREWDVNSVFTRETGEKVSVCRPKVGARVVGGGFVGIFKKLSVVGASLAQELAKSAAEESPTEPTEPVESETQSPQ